MALIQRSLMKMNAMRAATKTYSTRASIKKSVFISQSKDIYANLALQDWIYKNFDLSKHHILMLWRNDPCVTIGRNRNPWLELNYDGLPNITENGVKLARQKTDAEPMYHDSGNLNMTFFTSKDHFNENYNMEIISRALFRSNSLKMNVMRSNLTTRSDYDISTSTAKLGSENAYYHCSMLVNVNKMNFSMSTRREEVGIKFETSIQHKKTNNKMMNLCEEKSNVSVESILKAIGWEYMRTPAFNIKDGGNSLANQQKGFQLINPTEGWFPGISDIRSEISGWDWLIGSTPDFKIERRFRLPEYLVEGFSDELNLKLTVSGGVVKNIKLSPIPSVLSSDVSDEDINSIICTLIGHRFSGNIIQNLEDYIRNAFDEKDKFEPDALRQVMASF